MDRGPARLTGTSLPSHKEIALVKRGKALVQIAF